MNSRIKLKICGLKRQEDIEYVNRCIPDYIGFVFAPGRRQVKLEEARLLRKKLRDEIIPIGVFVNEEIENIARLTSLGIIDMVQLHGDESSADIMRLKEKVKKPIIKAVRVASRQDVTAGLTYPADYLLFDTAVKGQYGGSGEVFDWQLLKEVYRPFFLAGGLNSENIEEAVKRVRPFALDVSSGVETDGVKDENKIRRLAELLRGCDG